MIRKDDGKMDANTANTNRPRTPRTVARSARSAQSANAIPVSRLATKKETEQIRSMLTWFRDQKFTFSMLERDLGKSGGWCYKVLNDSDRYTVTMIDLMVIRASYRSALRLHERERHKYGIMQSIILHAGAIMRDVEHLAEEA
jgi:hypothetical protein